MADFGNGRLSFLDPLTKRFDGNVETDSIAKAEAIDDGLGRRVDHYRNPFDAVLLPALRESETGETEDAQFGVIQPRSARPPGESHPYLRRILRRHLMEDQRRKQANRGMRHPLCHFRERMEFSDWRVRNPVEAATGPLQNPLPQEPQKILSGNAMLFGVTRTKSAVLMHQCDEPLLERLLQDVTSMNRLYAYCNSLATEPVFATSGNSGRGDRPLTTVGAAERRFRAVRLQRRTPGQRFAVSVCSRASRTSQV